ncbi:hypothetical protein M5K25_016853 [Dendrobium thyrsiflorum]|uniref:Uncharacterized protein n=1 Tax=Dendrobium thyrsiflorum TaxID=117978 RepID=A0ABD0UL58_DENTH
MHYLLIVYADVDAFVSQYIMPNQQVCFSGLKHSWPELRGAEAGAAQAVIESERSDVTVIYVSCVDGITSGDFCCNRVWLWLDAPTHSPHFNHAKVCKEPTIG